MVSRTLTAYTKVFGAIGQLDSTGFPASYIIPAPLADRIAGRVHAADEDGLFE
jgi:hypothetical protein